MKYVDMILSRLDHQSHSYLENPSGENFLTGPAIEFDGIDEGWMYARIPMALTIN